MKKCQRRTVSRLSTKEQGITVLTTTDDKMCDEHENELWEAPFPNFADVAKRLSSFDRFLGTNDSKDLHEILREDDDNRSFASLEESSFNIGKISHAHEASMARLARHSGILEQFYQPPNTITLSSPPREAVNERSYQDAKVQSSKDTSQQKPQSSHALIPKSPRKSGSSSTLGDRSKHDPDPNNSLDMASKNSHSEHSRQSNRTLGYPNKDPSQSPGATNKSRISRRDLYGVTHRSKQRTVTSNRSSREGPRLRTAHSDENLSCAKRTLDHTSEKRRSRKEGSSSSSSSRRGKNSRSSSSPPPVPLDDGQKTVSLGDVSGARGLNRGERDAQLYGSVHRSKHRTPPSKLSSSHSDEGLVRSLTRDTTTSRPLANQSWHKNPSDHPSQKHRVRTESTSRSIRPGIGADVQKSRSSSPRSPNRVGSERKTVSLRNISGTRRGFSRAESDPQSLSSRKARSVRTLSAHNESTRREGSRSSSGNNLEDLTKVSGHVLPSSFSRVPKKSKSPGGHGTNGSNRHALERPDVGLSLSRSRSGPDVIQQHNGQTRTEAGSSVPLKQGHRITRVLSGSDTKDGLRGSSGHRVKRTTSVA